MEDEIQQNNDIIVPAQDVNSALMKGLKSAARDLAVNDVTYLPRSQQVSPEVRQISDYEIIEKKSETSAQRNFRNLSIISSSLGIWHLTSGIIKVSCVMTGSLGAGIVIPGIAIFYCGAKSVTDFINKEYSSSIGFSLYGGMILLSGSTTIFPIWQAKNETESDLKKYRQEKREYQQYSEGYKAPLDFGSYVTPAIIFFIVALILFKKNSKK